MRKRKEASRKEGVNGYLREPIQVKRAETENVLLFQRLDEGQ